MKSRWTVLLSGFAVAVLVLVLGPATERAAHADVLQDAINAYWNQDGEITPQSEWQRFEIWQPPSWSGLTTTNSYGQVDGIWGCVHWPQLHGTYYHSIGSDITCGYIDVFPVGHPPDTPTPAGYEWGCIPGVNILVYSVPFNKGICQFWNSNSLPQGFFAPTQEQLAARDSSLNALLQYYAGNSAEVNRQEAMRLYNSKGYLRIEEELSQERMPEEVRQRILRLIDIDKRQRACKVFAEAATKAEGQRSVKSATLVTVKGYLDLSSEVLPIGKTKGVFKMASILASGFKAPLEGGDKALQSVIGDYEQNWTDLALQNHKIASTAFAVHNTFESSTSMFNSWNRSKRLMETSGERIRIRTTKCELATRR